MINKDLIKKFDEKFSGDAASVAVAGAIAKSGINDASLNNNVARRHNHMFSVTTKRGKITNQKSSGRCWMFAALNTARVDTMKKYDMKTLEFSQNYTLFWDKMERSNYTLDAIIETADEPLDSRIVKHILFDPLCDGGQWDMFKAILDKYGVVPKDHMPETFHSSNTRILDTYLTSMLRYFAYVLRTEVEKTGSKESAKALKEDMLYKIYNILVKALGNPPQKVNFEYQDKDEKYHRLPEMTPQEFFKETVGWNLKERVSVINAPTKDKPYGKTYTVKFLGNVVEADPVKYLNVPIDVLKEATLSALKDGEPVWFGCDVGKLSEGNLGIMDLDTFNYAETLGYYPEWDKETQLDYYESQLTHAMVFTGVNIDPNGKVVNWEVENSWGDKVGKKGMYSMSDEWFDRFMYQVMVDRKYLPEEWREKLELEPIELAPWDPMGSLAL